jgi:putative inorganic carbon (hco3(-)) transporter
MLALRDVLLTLILAALLPVSFVRPWIGVLVWYWLGFMNPHKMVWGFAQTVPWAQLAALATLGGLFFTRDRKMIPFNFQLVLIVVMFLHFTFTSFFAWSTSAAWTQWEKVGKILLMTYVTTMLIYGRKRIWALLLTMALSIGYFGFKGAIFTVQTGGVFRVQGPGDTFIGGNVNLGLAMVMVVPLLLFLARDEPRLWLQRLLKVVGWCTAFSTIFTYSRGAMVALVAIAPFALLHTRRKFLVLAVLIPLAYFGKDYLPQELVSRTQTIQEYKRDESARLRLQAWDVSYNIALEKPLTGAGFNFEYSGQDERWLSYTEIRVPNVDNIARAAHSGYFQVMGQHGLVGFALYITLLVSSLVSLRRLQSRASARPDCAWLANASGALFIGLIGYMVAGAFVSLAYFDLMFVYVAMIAIFQRELDTQRETADQYGRGGARGPQPRSLSREIGQRG